LSLKCGRVAWLGLAAALVAHAQVAILQIRVVEGEGAVLQPGARASRPITVEITEETGKPVPGAAVSFHLPEDGPGGTFTNGLRTEVVVTDERGRASLHGLTANRTPGRFQIRIVVSKEQARAGTVSFQYIAESKGGTAARGSTAPAGSTATGPSHNKLLLIGVAIAGAAAAGLAVARGGSSNSGSTNNPPSTPTVTTSIGTPGISVSKP
jgi:hypothetical protein